VAAGFCAGLASMSDLEKKETPIMKKDPSADSSKASSSFRKRFFQVLWIVLATLGGLFAVDFGVGTWKYASYFRTPHPEYHHGLIPGVSEVLERWGDTHYVVSVTSLGFKDLAAREDSWGNTTGSYRLLLLGDSFTEGIGLPARETFAGLLEPSLQSLLSRDVRVFNAGVVSYAPNLYYKKCAYLLEKGLSVDEVLVFIDISDIQDEVVYRSYEGKEPFSVNIATTFWYRHSWLYRELVGSFVKVLRKEEEEAHDLFGDRYNKVRGSWPHTPESLASWAETGLELAKAHMLLLGDLCKEHGLPLTVAVYPWPENLRHDPDPSPQERFWKDLAEDQGWGFVSLYPVFREAAATQEEVVERYFFEGDVHWNAQGHGLVLRGLLDQWRPAAGVE